jgi:CHAT domain-containing protein/Tfp pilus assembly protein PilF
MFNQTIGCMRRNFSARKSHSCLPLMGVLWLLFGQIPPAQTSDGSPPSTQLPSQQQTSGSQNTQELAALDLGKHFERELSGGQKHTYQLALTEGQYATVTVEQKGIDIVARLLAPDGQLIADVDSGKTEQGSEGVELVAEDAGTYKIEVAPSLPKAVAGTYVIKLSEVREAAANEKLLYEARKQYYESLRLNETVKTEKALGLANRSLKIRENILGPDHADVAASLRLLGNLYQSKDDLTQAEAVFQRAAEISAKTPGFVSLDYADAVHGLARVRSIKGDLAQAEELNLRALSIREKIAGPDSLAAANSLFNLALIYRATNDLPKAEQMYLKVLAIREKFLGSDHLEMSHLFNNLGYFYYGVGDLSSAEPLLKRALAVREKVLGPNNFHVGATLNNLGLLEWKKGDYDKAEAYYRRAMSIFEKASGPESHGVANSLHNLGIIYKEARHDYAKAEEYYKRALAILEKIFGENHENTANAVTSLAILYRTMGDYDRAERFFLRSLASYERASGQYNHGTVRSLRSLVKLYAMKGDTGRAVEYQRRISAREEKIIPLNLTIGSERQKFAYFTAQLQKPDITITLHARLARDDEAARDLAATTVLQRKGRILDALSENLLALRRRFNTQDQSLLDGLSALNSQLSRLVLSGPQKRSLEEHQHEIKTLQEQRERLEAEISRRSAGSYEVSQPVTLAAVQAIIPSDAAIIEFATYHPYDWKAADNKSAYGEPRYVVYVIRNRGEVRWAELGPAKDVDSAVEVWRQALRDPRRPDVQQLARVVDEKVMKPVRALTGDAKQLLVSPDGELNLIPFEALVDGKGRYLVEDYAVAYLTSGRDLLRMQVARESRGKPTVIANPSFGEPGREQLASVAGRPAAARSKRRSVTAARDLSEVYFAPLRGTAQEARTIQATFPNAKLLTGMGATESALKQVAAPNILHIATHGFFLQDAPDPTSVPVAQPGSRGVSASIKSVPGADRGPQRGNPAGVVVATGWVAPVTTQGISANPRIENPLLRSGLALADANLRSRPDGEDGILTALEASGLDLWGTKLVVLSACDTGVGEVRNGEGVYGLRRAFVLAGAESLVMSLWPISDYATRKLMTNYYKNLKQGLGRGESLRQVQLDMLRRNKDLHPFYWANFIQSGEWANLDGKR